MMSRQSRVQPRLFYEGFSLDQRVRANHPLRKIAKAIDFDFVYDEVGDLYGTNGNPSVPPPVIVKLMLLLLFYNVRSERELMDTLPERLDWLWFVGFDLDTPIPNHSVLSKACNRWGPRVFRSLFERVVWQCVEAGLVDGGKIFVDSSLVDADASMESLVPAHSLKHQVHRSYAEFQGRLEEALEDPNPRKRKQNRRQVSTTDPDAAIFRDGKARLTYKVHRAVDRSHEIITASRTTPGSTYDAHVMTALLDDHQQTSGHTAHTLVGDSLYGTIENLLIGYDRGTKIHTTHLGLAAAKRTDIQGIIQDDQFHYEPARDVFVCPMGRDLKRAGWDRTRDSIAYRAGKKVCKGCPLLHRCSRAKRSGRSLRRHLRQAELDHMRRATQTRQAKRDLRTRQHLAEWTFARGKRYGYDRARWRRLWRMEIQELLICTIQNIAVLIKNEPPPPRARSFRMTTPRFFPSWSLFAAVCRRFEAFRRAFRMMVFQPPCYFLHFPQSSDNLPGSLSVRGATHSGNSPKSFG